MNRSKEKWGKTSSLRRVLRSWLCSPAKRVKKLLKQFQNSQCEAINYIDFSSKNQTIPVNPSEEKWEKHHF